MRGRAYFAALGKRVNTSATENIPLALPGHEFEIVALDGNPVPTPHKVSVLALGVAERIDAVAAPKVRWDYTRFGLSRAAAAPPDVESRRRCAPGASPPS